MLMEFSEKLYKNRTEAEGENEKSASKTDLEAKT
jgi:hypothetical protein